MCECVSGLCYVVPILVGHLHVHARERVREREREKDEVRRVHCRCSAVLCVHLLATLRVCVRVCVCV